MHLNIPARKRKKYLLNLAVHFFLLWFLINMIIKTKSMENMAFNGLFNYIIATLGIVYVVYKIAMFILVIGREWIDASASLTITNTDISNQLNYYSSGIFSFHEIKETQLIKSKEQEYLLLILKQPRTFISGKSLFKQWHLNKLVKRTGSPIVFQQEEVDYNLRELQLIIDDHLQDKRTT